MAREFSIYDTQKWRDYVRAQANQPNPWGGIHYIPIPGATGSNPSARPPEPTPYDAYLRRLSYRGGYPRVVSNPERLNYNQIANQWSRAPGQANLFHSLMNREAEIPDTEPYVPPPPGDDDDRPGPQPPPEKDPPPPPPPPPDPDPPDPPPPNPDPDPDPDPRPKPKLGGPLGPILRESPRPGPQIDPDPDPDPPPVPEPDDPEPPPPPPDDPRPPDGPPPVANPPPPPPPPPEPPVPPTGGPPMAAMAPPQPPPRPYGRQSAIETLISRMRSQPNGYYRYGPAS